MTIQSNDPNVITNPTAIKPPSAGLAGLAGLANQPIDTGAATPNPTPQTEQQQPTAPLTPEEQAKIKAIQDAADAKAKKDAEKLAKAQAKLAAAQAKKDAAAQAKADKEAKAKADKEAKEAEKKAKAEQRKAELEAKRNIKPPVGPEVQIKELPQNIIKALESGKASDALKTAFSQENNAELGYKKLGERFGWSVTPLIEQLVAEKVWPVKDEKDGGGPWGYKKLLEAEKENGLQSWGTMVNRASERFTMLNPENIAKREAARHKLEAERLEQEKIKAAGIAAGLIPETTKKTTTTSSTETATNVAGLTQEKMIELAHACIMAMTEDSRNKLCALEDIQKALNLLG